MANFKLTQTGEQIQADLNLLDSNSATSGQVLTANGSGGSSWQNVSGDGTQLYSHTVTFSGFNFTGSFSYENQESTQPTKEFSSFEITSGIEIISFVSTPVTSISELVELCNDKRTISFVYGNFLWLYRWLVDTERNNILLGNSTYSVDPSSGEFYSHFFGFQIDTFISDTITPL